MSDWIGVEYSKHVWILVSLTLKGNHFHSTWLCTNVRLLHCWKFPACWEIWCFYPSNETFSFMLLMCLLCQIEELMITFIFFWKFGVFEPQKNRSQSCWWCTCYVRMKEVNNISFLFGICCFSTSKEPPSTLLMMYLFCPIGKMWKNSGNLGTLIRLTLKLNHFLKTLMIYLRCRIEIFLKLCSIWGALGSLTLKTTHFKTTWSCNHSVRLVHCWKFPTCWDIWCI